MDVMVVCDKFACVRVVEFGFNSVPEIEVEECEQWLCRLAFEISLWCSMDRKW